MGVTNMNVTRIALLVVGFFLSQALFADEWFCTDESAKRSGNVISVCGVGDGLDEGAARHRALGNALTEFHTLCDLSADCAEHKLSAEPKRTTCSTKPNGLIKCYRLVEVTILN